MVTIATGPRPPSRSARIGEAFGTGINTGFLDAFERSRRQKESGEAVNAFLELQSGLNAPRPTLGAGTGFGVLAPDVLQQRQSESRTQRLTRLLQENPRAVSLLAGTDVGRAFLPRLFPDREIREVNGRLVDVTGDGANVLADFSEPESFTLSPGQRRVSATGEVIAEGASTPQTFSRVIAGDSELNRRFGLGIPAGERARVEFTRDPESGGIAGASVQSAFGTPQTSVTVRTGQEFQEQLGKGAAPQVNDIVTRGQRAVGTQQDLLQMADLLVAGTQTGQLQSLVTPLQGIAEDLGIDTSAIGDLSKKENFDRLSRTIIIDGFEKFKGNLNQKEVEIAENAFANIGRTEESNIDAVAAGLAAEQIARERAQQATQVRTFEQARALQGEILSSDVSRFEQLKQRFKDQIQQQQTSQPAPEVSTLPEGVPAGSRQVGTTSDGLPVFETPDGQQLVVE